MWKRGLFVSNLFAVFSDRHVVLAEHVAVDVSVVFGRVLTDLARVDAGVTPFVVRDVLQAERFYISNLLIF